MSPSTHAESSLCPECGAELKAGQHFCSRCGAARSSGSTAELSDEERTNLRRRLGGSTWVAPEDAVASQPPAAVATAALSAPRRRRRRRTWFRKKRFVLPLLVMLLVGGGVATAMLRAESTISELQRISTPPDQVTIQDQGGDAVTDPAIAIDTGPAQEALADAGVDDGADIGGLRDRASNLGGLAEGAAVAAGVRDPSTDALTILMMGVDARPGAQIDIAVRPDALMVGGIPYQRLVVEQFLGISIDRYALIDFLGFQEMVDAVGGVPITVPSEIKINETVVFKAGPTTFDGEDALRYARYRGGADVDVGRVRRQQQLIRSLALVASSRDIVRDINDLLPAVEDHVRTDLSPVELAELGKRYATTCGEDRLQLDTIPGQLETPTTPDPLFKEPLTYIVVEPEVVAARVAALLGRDPVTP